MFGRDASFDPRIDPIVRVDARRLRAKLREYYDGEGADDRIEICLPLRTYVPVFRSRDAQPTVAKSLIQFRADRRARKSIGVFPFTSLSAEREDEFFADGLTEELIHALAALSEWRVVAGDVTTRNARRPDLREMGAELDIDVAVWGTVRKVASTYRISAELLATKDRTVLWSEMYESPDHNVIPMQTKIARAICDAMHMLRDVSRTGQTSQRRLAAGARLF